MDKGLSIFQKIDGLVLTAFNEVRKCIVYILDDIIVFFYQWLYNAAAYSYLIHPLDTKYFSGNASPLLLLNMTYK